MIVVSNYLSVSIDYVMHNANIVLQQNYIMLLLNTSNEFSPPSVIQKFVKVKV